MTNIEQGAFYTNKYRNMLADSGISEVDIENRIMDTWNQLFEGNEHTRIYANAEDDMGYMIDTGNLDVRSEGMSYGMMMAVQMNRKDIFDRLWKWTFTYMF